MHLLHVVSLKNGDKGGAGNVGGGSMNTPLIWKCVCVCGGGK